jgi:hypothetical protein
LQWRLQWAGCKKKSVSAAEGKKKLLAAGNCKRLAPKAAKKWPFGPLAQPILNANGQSGKRKYFRHTLKNLSE